MKRLCKRFVPVLIIGAVLSVITACAQSPSPATPRYQIFEMRSDMTRPVFPAVDQNVAWLDEERVLFEGWDRRLKDTEPSLRQATGAWRGLYIWNIRTGDVTRHTNEPLRSSMCFADGYVNYGVARGGQQVYLEGLFGKEKPTVPLPSQSRDRQVNRFTCMSYDRSSLPRPLIGGGIEPLRPEHGWLEHSGNASWLRPNDKTLIRLEHETQPIKQVFPQKYSAVSGNYLFWQPFRDKTWLIEPTGRMVLQAPPAEDIGKGRIEPAAGGASLLRARGINTRAAWDPGTSGLYVYKSGPAERIFRGIVDAMSVHPHGCLVAVILDPWDREGREPQLKAVNICLGDGYVG